MRSVISLVFRVAFLYRLLQTLPDSQLVEFLFLFKLVNEDRVNESENKLKQTLTARTEFLIRTFQRVVKK